MMGQPVVDAPDGTPEHLFIPVPLLLQKGHEDSELCARAMARGTFKVDPTLYEWRREWTEDLHDGPVPHWRWRGTLRTIARA